MLAVVVESVVPGHRPNRAAAQLWVEAIDGRRQFYPASVSPSLFDAMVRDGRMPGPKVINTRTVWDRFALDRAFEALPDRDSANQWDEDGPVP